MDYPKGNNTPDHSLLKDMYQNRAVHVLASRSPEDALFTMSLSYRIAESCHLLFNIVNTGNWKPAILFVFKASKDAQCYVN